MPHLSDLPPVDDHPMPGSEGRPGDLRRSLPGQLVNGQGLGEAEVAADLIAQVARLAGDVEVLERGPLPGDEISHLVHVSHMDELLIAPSAVPRSRTVKARQQRIVMICGPVPVLHLPDGRLAPQGLASPGER